MLLDYLSNNDILNEMYTANTQETCRKFHSDLNLHFQGRVTCLPKNL